MTKISTSKLDASGAPVLDMGTRTSWDFQNQYFIPIDGILGPGDTVRTQCQFKNATDHVVSFGERTEDEMCFTFAIYWPKITTPGWTRASLPLRTPCQPFISRDGTTLYFHNLTDRRIYAATRATSVTSFATTIDVLGPTSVDGNLSPVVTSDGSRLYFASFRANNVGGAGNSDVWTATQAAGDIFGNAENAGTINSEADDTPTAVTDDGCILYFVSKRAGGAGGSDIWSAKRGL